MLWTLGVQGRRRSRAQALRRTIGELPPQTRQAMLDATDTDELIVGAYTDRFGRPCPMLAAHRRGARTCARGFPRAWDAFGRASRPRRASERELQILRALLQESLAGGEAWQVPIPAQPPVGAAVP